MDKNVQNSENRRNFIKKVSLVSMAAIVSEGLMAMPKEKKKIKIEANDIILFQGDSITDASRKKEIADANHPAALGTGYAFLASAHLLKNAPGKQLKIYNRGVSGNKVYQLTERWDDDCFKIKPTVLSILVGVNDFWHTLEKKYNGSLDKYHTDYLELLTKTKNNFPDLRLIIGEPFAINGVLKVTDQWFPAFNDYRLAAREIAAKFDAELIPYQSFFDKAQQLAPANYWTADGVHPTLAGAELMAQAWLQAIKY